MNDSARWPWPRLIAHRGGGRLAPENTLAAFRVGQAHGFRMMEYDVQLSADDVPILLHDEDIRRTSSGRGMAHRLDLAQLRRHDFGAWHGAAFADEPIPTLAEVAAFCQAHGLAGNIEIKPASGLEAHTGRIVAGEAARLWSQTALPPLLSSFSASALEAAARAAPQLPRALLVQGDVPPDWRERVQRLGAIGLNVHHSRLDEKRVRRITASGHTLVAWTVNDHARAQALLDWGCHAIVTDMLDSINPQTLN